VKIRLGLNASLFFQSWSRSQQCILASLGKSQESYGALLVTIILVTKIQNLTRAHRRQDCKINELQKAILDEIYILEAGLQIDPHTSLPQTASFHTDAVNKPVVGTRSKPHCPNPSLTLCM